MAKGRPTVHRANPHELLASYAVAVHDLLAEPLDLRECVVSDPRMVGR